VDLITKFSITQSKVVGKFRSKQFGCKKRLDLLTVDVLNGFYCTTLSVKFSDYVYFTRYYDLFDFTLVYAELLA